ncbi:MAG: hypothetical protein WC309_03595 [Candidatus Paceibacterota bacterium]
MNTYYMRDVAGTNQVYFEVDPIVSPYPEIIPHIQEVVSIPGLDESDNPVAPIHSFLDFGTVAVGGIIHLQCDYMSLTRFNSFIAKFMANPPATQHFHDYGRTTTYEVILKDFKFAYNEHTVNLNWSMELINLGVVT